MFIGVGNTASRCSGASGAGPAESIDVRRSFDTYDCDVTPTLLFGGEEGFSSLSAARLRLTN